MDKMLHLYIIHIVGTSVKGENDGFLQIAAGGDPGWLRYLSILVEGPWISRSRTFCACFGVVIGGPCLTLRGAEGERGAF
jgi:hypothetical protein